MGNNIFSQEYLKFDRMIDGESQIVIGIVAKKDPNPYSSQAIRIGLDGKLKRLETFEQTENCLKFNYESDTTLSITKRNDEIIVCVKEPDTNTNIIKPMVSICREIFKPIKFGDLSQEYDKIPDFIRPKFEDIKTELGKSLASENMDK
jgi:hypothetical protein